MTFNATAVRTITEMDLQTGRTTTRVVFSYNGQEFIGEASGGTYAPAPPPPATAPSSASKWPSPPRQEAIPAQGERVSFWDIEELPLEYKKALMLQGAPELIEEEDLLQRVNAMESFSPDEWAAVEYAYAEQYTTAPPAAPAPSPPAAPPAPLQRAVVPAAPLPRPLPAQVPNSILNPLNVPQA